MQALTYKSIKESLKNFVEWSFQRKGSPYHAGNEETCCFASEHQNRYKLRSCQIMYEVLTYLEDEFSLGVTADNSILRIAYRFISNL